MAGINLALWLKINSSTAIGSVFWDGHREDVPIEPVIKGLSDHDDQLLLYFLNHKKESF